jgi:serine/threonine protein kinase
LAPEGAQSQAVARPRQPPKEFGRYRIDSTLGEGGMGTVYLAHDTQLGRPVALKVPLFTPEDGPEVLQRFYREARTAATILHPNICPVYDVGEIDGIHYLTMAYIEGKLLWFYIAGGQPLPPRQAAGLVRKLALALQEAHNRGIIHRDLKPSNVIINKSGEPIIMDFGLARRIDDPSQRLTKTGQVLGTIVYMSPEQVTANNDLMGPPADIYSLGVILYELITAHPPYEGTPASVVTSIVMGVAPRARERRSDIPARLDAICAKAMEKEIASRFPSMAAFAAALTDYLRQDTQAGPLAVAPPAARKPPTDKNPKLGAKAEAPKGARPNGKKGMPQAAPARTPQAPAGAQRRPAAANPAKKPAAAADRVASAPELIDAAPRIWQRVPKWAWIVGGVGAIVILILGVWLAL